ncbi:tandem-95 repeat protein [Thalassolituus oleivorans]|uniref:tandem-95 repeat protein n=1 Tax=Thalassolituus oleivorans TaxID=187493 RepID=UPI0023F0CB6A|nr:Ig-like domain-containing protein [Thalassolituus oleivorans]
MSYVRFGLVLSMFLVLSACSSDGGSSDSGSTTVDIVITDPDKAAAFLDIFSDPVTQATEDERWEYALVTSAVLAENLSFRLVSGPSGMTISPDGLVQWTPTDEHGDTVNVTIEATYSDENGTVSRSQTFLLPVKHINDKPVITSVAPVTTVAGTTFSYQLEVNDPDDVNNGTDLIFAVSLPSVELLGVSPEEYGVTISPTGLLQWQVPTDPGIGLLDPGLRINVTVTDGEEDWKNGFVARPSQKWNLKVVTTNTAPDIKSSPVTVATEDVAYSYQLDVSDAEDDNNGADLTFALLNSPAGMTVSSIGLIQWTPIENGAAAYSESVEVSVADGGENGVEPVTQSFSINVTPVNDAPTFIGSPSTSAIEGSAYTYALQVTDPDDANNGTDLTFSLTSAPAGMTISSTGVISWTAPANVTSASVEAIVADGGENGAAAASLSWTISVDAVNDAPTITSVAPTMATEDSPYVYQLVVADPDDDNNGTDLTFTLVTAPEGMTVSATGAIAWTPVGHEGTVDVTIEVADGGENGVQPASQNFTIAVTAVNDAPVITSEAVVTATEDETYSYEVSATDEENDVLQWSLTTAPEGMIIDSATGVITWTPAETVTSEAVVVEVSDGEFNDTQSFTVAVTAVNDAPVITEGEATALVTDEDTATTLTLNATDVDTDSASLIWTIDTDALNGAAIVSGTGASQTVTYTPTANFSGSDSFVVAVSDGELVATITVNVTVTEAGDAPVITEGENVSLTTNEDNLVLTVLSATDLDTDAANLSWSANDATNGQASVSGSGLTQTVTYIPNANFSGNDSFIVTVSDGVLSDMITVSVTVNSVNDAPVITSVPNTSATEAVAYSYAVTASDVEGDTLTWSLTEAPAGMEIDADTGVINWTPGNAATNPTVVIQVSDGAASSTQTFVIEIGAVNDAPVITEGDTAQINTSEDTVGSITLNATDADSATLTWSVVSVASNGSASVSGNGLSKTVNYTPNADFSGTDSFVVAVSDGSLTDTIAISVNVAAVNDAPMFISAPSTNAIEASLYQYTAQVSDADDANNGTDLTFTLTQAPEGMTVSATGVVQWTPGNTVTTADVTLEVIDGGEDGTVAAVQSWTITVGSVNDSPEITSAAIVTATEGMVYQYPVQVTDPDDANNGTDLTFELTTAPAGMTVSSMGLIEWTPTNDDVSVPVTVVVRDGGESGAVPATQSWTIAVTPVNDAPEITQGATTTLAVEEDVLASLGLNATDIDTAAANLTWSVSTVATNGTASVSGTGSSKSVSYVPNADFNGSDEFVVTVSDGELSDTITVNVTVNAVNDAPVMTSAAVTDATEDEAYTYAATATDIDGDTLTWSLTEFPEGMAIDASSGVISWTPANGVETANVTLVVADADVSATQTFTITVSAVNDAPIITSIGTQAATEGVEFTYTVVASDIDTGDVLAFSLTGEPAGMTIDSVTGVITWTPGNGAVDSSVTVNVFDGTVTSTKTFTITIGAVNDAPVITEGEAATLTTDEDVVGNLVLNATDADTDAANITWSIASAASNGTANVTGTGLSQTVSYSPNADFNGSDSFTVSITDGALTDTITVNVTVNAVNDAPFINSAANTHATEGVLYTYTAMASDVESDTLTWSLTQSPEGMTIDANSGVISWTPANGVTSADITVQVADAEANATQSFTVTVGGVNDAPTITETTAAITTDEDTSGTITLNATDIDGDTITWSVGSAAANGVATVSGTGLSQVVSYAPNADFNGTDSFVVRITDDSLTDTITVNVTVNAANDAPAITETTAAITTDEDTSGTVTLNATDIDGDTINWSVGLAATNGVATVSGAGLSQVVSYAPNANFNGTDSFIVSITDGSLTDTITVDVTVNAANDAPVITSTAITSATEGEVYTYTVTATDAENDTLIWSLTTAPSGMNIDSATGVITWTPGNGAISENVVVEVTDSVATTTQSFTITIGAVNDAPVITEGATAALSTDEDTAGTVTLNATDADSAILTWTVSSAASNGSATVTGTGLSKTVSYTPNANFNGTDSFVVTVSDGSASDTITVNVSVAPIADAPVITEGETSAQSTDEDTAKTFALNATDVDGSTITWTIGSAATNGTASVSGNGASNTVSYTPNTNFNGTDSFVVLVSDGALTDTITVTMTVNAVNDIPVISSTAITSATEGQVYSYVPAATDVDGDTLTWSLGASAPASMSVNPTTGELSWTPSNGDTSATIQLFASDGTLRAEQNFTIAVTAVNDAPVITEGENVSVTMSEDATPQAFSLVLNATDADNAAAELTWTIASVAANGSATVSGTGTSKVVNYTPSADYNGADSFVVNVTDGTDSDTITVNVTVDAANDAPAITETTAAIVTDEDVSGSVTLNATDIDTDAASITWTILTQAANGTASVNAVNTGASMLVTYAPSVNTNGSDSFVVQISDGELTDTITVNVTVNALDDAPAIAQGSTIDLITDENTAGSVALTAVDIDTDAANLIWTVITDATDGVASISGSGTNVSADYTPTANFSGNDSFVVQLSDGTSNVSITVNVTVNAVNEAPVITNGATATMTTNEDTQATLSLAATDADGDTLTWSIPVGSGASQGGVAVDGTGLVTYVPSLDTNGTDTFSVQVSDGELTDTIAVTVTITAVNDAPVITEGSTSVLNTNEDDDTGSLTFSATDADGDALTWSVNTGAQHGIVTLNGSQFSYAPNIDFNGSDSFIVQVTDGVASATNTVTVNVAAVNDAPMVTSTAVTTAIENQVYAYNVTASDVEGDAISYSLTTSPSGMAIDSTTGEIRWIPSATGTETVVVSVTDGSDADTQTFDISVQAEPAVAGRAVKGVLSNATVEAATYGGLDSNGDHVWNLIGTTTTDAQGYFGFDLGPQSAPVRVRVTTDANSTMVCDTPSGCVLSTFALYGETGAPDVGLTLDTIVSGADFGGPIAVTPLTNMAAVWLQQFPQAIDDNNILLTHRRLSELFGFGDENYMLQRVIDITSPFELSQAVATDMNRVRHAVFAASLQETATVKGLSVNTISDGLGLMFGVLGGQMPLKSGTIDVTALNLTDGTTSLDYTGFDTFIISAKTVANYVNVGSALDSMIAGFDALVTRWSPEVTDPSICLDTDPLVDRTECRNVTTLGEATGYDVANFDRAVAPLDEYNRYYNLVVAAEAGINQTNRSLDWLYVTTEDQTNTANMLSALTTIIGFGTQTSICVPQKNAFLSCTITVPAEYSGVSAALSSCSGGGTDTCKLTVTGTANGQTYSVTSYVPDIRRLLGGDRPGYLGGDFTAGPLDMCFNGSISNTTASLELTNFCVTLDVSGSPATALAPFKSFKVADFGNSDKLNPALADLLKVIYLEVSASGKMVIRSTDSNIGAFTSNNMDMGLIFDREVINGNKAGPIFEVYMSSLSRTNPAGETLNSISGQDLFRLEINDTSYMTTAKVEDKIGLPAVTTTSNVTIEGLTPIIAVMKSYAESLIDTTKPFVAPTAERWQEIQDEVAANLVYGGTQTYTMGDTNDTYTMTLDQGGFIDISQKNSTANAMRIFLSGAAGYIYADETLVATAHLGNSQDGLMISLMDGSQRTYTSANPDPLGGLQGFLDFLTILAPPSDTTTTP